MKASVPWENGEAVAGPEGVPGRGSVRHRSGGAGDGLRERVRWVIFLSGAKKSKATCDPVDPPGQRKAAGPVMQPEEGTKCLPNPPAKSFPPVSAKMADCVV